MRDEWLWPSKPLGLWEEGYGPPPTPPPPTLLPPSLTRPIFPIYKRSQMSEVKELSFLLQTFHANRKQHPVTKHRNPETLTVLESCRPCLFPTQDLLERKAAALKLRDALRQCVQLLTVKYTTPPFLKLRERRRLLASPPVESLVG